MPVITTGPVQSALADENGQFSVSVKILNRSKKQRAVLIKGFSFEETINPDITQVVNIYPNSEITKSYSGTTGTFQFNFQVLDYTGIQISVWRNNGISNEELPLTYVG